MNGIRIIQALSILALIIAGYQTWSHYQPIPTEGTFCDINEYWSCSTVTHSTYGYLFGIPVAILGLLGFGAILFLTLLPSNQGRNTALVVSSTIGALFSAYLTYAEFFILNTVCPLCLTIFIIILMIAGICLQTWGRETHEFFCHIEIVD